MSAEQLIQLRICGDFISFDNFPRLSYWVILIVVGHSSPTGTIAIIPPLNAGPRSDSGKHWNAVI